MTKNILKHISKNLLHSNKLSGGEINLITLIPILLVNSYERFTPYHASGKVNYLHPCNQDGERFCITESPNF